MQEKRNRQYMSIMLCVIMVISMLPLASFNTFADYETYTSGYYQYIVIDGKATITAYTGSSATVNIPSVLGNYSVTRIQQSAFYGKTSLRRATIPDGVEYIGQGAFSDCSSLESVNIPDSVTEIAGNPFSGTALYNDENNWEDGVLYIDNCLIKAKKETVPAYYTVKDGTRLIAGFAFAYCSSLRSVSFPDTIVEIGQFAFKESGIYSIVIPDGITRVRSGMFSNCGSLRYVTIPDSVTQIGQTAFSGCTSLNSITLPDNLTNIGQNSFQGCTSLTSITIPDGVNQLNNYTFYGCTALTKIVIPESVTTIYNSVFDDCPSLTIYGYPDSYAESYANSHHISFKSLIIHPQSITLSNDILYLSVAESYRLTLIINPVDCTDIPSWKSSNKNVATVDSYGNIHAVGAGTTKIKVIVGEMSAVCTVYVDNFYVSSIVLNESSVSILLNESFDLSATVYPEYAQNKTLSWSSSDNNVASVDQNGTVTAVGVGVATITATSTDGSNVSASCTVIVGNTSYVVETFDFQSKHNYDNNSDFFWVYEGDNTCAISITFNSGTNVEEDFDFIYIYDEESNKIGCYTGTELAGQTIRVEGSAIIVELVSDESGSEWGFKVDSVVCQLCGDIDNDGDVDITDYELAKASLQGGTLSHDELNAADFDRDSVIDAFDLFYIDKTINGLY